jgi:hypothetical protein
LLYAGFEPQAETSLTYEQARQKARQ